MAKDAGQMHGLHQLMRSWLLAEDPYGMNNRIEPTMGTQSPPGAPALGGAGSAPSAPVQPGQPIRARDAGTRAVDKALNQPPTRYSETSRDPRAQAQGESAVDKALTPSTPRYSEAARDPRAQAWGEQAVGDATAQPGALDMSGAPGYASPEEAQMTAQAAGQGAVQRALDKMARGSPMFAPARTSDPNMPRSQSRSRSPGKSEEDDTPTE